MNLQRSLPRALALAGLLGFLVSGCQEAPAKPAVTGTNEAFVAGGSADDGDDVTTGPAKQFAAPDRSASDGPSVAVSDDPRSFRTLSGHVVADEGPEPVRDALAVSTNRVTSTFTVTEAVTCHFELSSTASASLTIGGKGSYTVLARVLDSQGKYVTDTDFQTVYRFTRAMEGRVDAARDGVKFTSVANGDPIVSADPGPRDGAALSPFTLQPGTYTLLFELNIDAQAKERAEITVSASVDLI